MPPGCQVTVGGVRIPCDQLFLGVSPFAGPAGLLGPDVPGWALPGTITTITTMTTFRLLRQTNRSARFAQVTVEVRHRAGPRSR